MGRPDIATPARVQLGYDAERYGASTTVTQPFVVAVAADLQGDSAAPLGQRPLADRKFVDIDLDNRDARIRQIGPAVELVGEDGEPVVLDFEALGDFSPLGIARRHPVAQALLARRTLLAELLGRLSAHRELIEPCRALFASAPARHQAPPPWFTADNEDPQQVAARFAALLDEMRQGTLGPCDASDEPDPVKALSDRIQTLDDDIGRCVTAVLTDPAFRRLEGAWRGVDLLLQHAGPREGSRVRVLSLTRDELDRALAQAGGELDRRLLDDEFAVLGGEPVGVWVLADEFSHNADDVRTLRGAARLASRANALVVAAASPVLLDSDAYAAAITARGARLQRLTEYAAWRQLRADPAASHLALVVPRVAARDRHALAGLGYGEFRYVEPPASAASAPWMSGAFVLAAAVLKVQVRDGWPAALDDMSGPIGLPPTATWTGVDATGTLNVATPLDTTFSFEEAADLAAVGLTVLGRADLTTGMHLLAAPVLLAPPWQASGAPAQAGLVRGLALDQIARWLRCWALRSNRGRGRPVRPGVPSARSADHPDARRSRHWRATGRGRELTGQRCCRKPKSSTSRPAWRWKQPRTTPSPM